MVFYLNSNIEIHKFLDKIEEEYKTPKFKF